MATTPSPGRLTWLPIYEHEGRQLLHLGVSGRQATTYDDRIRFRTRDAMRAGVSTQWPVPADITVFGDTMQWLNLEFAAVQGPVDDAGRMAAQQHARRPADRRRRRVGAVDSLLYQGGYVQLLYFLTGESDNYSLEKMAFDRLKPFENCFWVRDAERLSDLRRAGPGRSAPATTILDLNDQGINGGAAAQLHRRASTGSGIPTRKWQFNYIATYRDVSQASDRTSPTAAAGFTAGECGLPRIFSPPLQGSQS